MPSFWIDTNVFISSKNGLLGFDIAPGFWSFHDEQADAGEIRAPSLVYNELVDESDDELAEWAKERSDGPLFVQPSEAVQAELTRVADHVRTAYMQNQAAAFLFGADPWVVAHALADGGTVVTLETRVSLNSKKAKIPNVCDHFGVEWTPLTAMLRSLGLRL